jgi:hypothetical protein
LDAFAADSLDPEERAAEGRDINIVTKHLTSKTIEPEFVTPERQLNLIPLPRS